jgi:hypothetical protein
MADLTDEFSMGETPGTGTIITELVMGQKWILAIVDDVYKHEQGKRTPLEENQIRVFACEQVNIAMPGAESWWQALTDALVAVLKQYPLKGK